MNEAIANLSNTDLQNLIAALQSRRLAPPYAPLQLSRIMPATLTVSVQAVLSELEADGFSPEQIAKALTLIHLDRKRDRLVELPIDLVTSGPDAPGITNRDTSVVVRELFAHARQSVLVVGYAVYQGQQVFESLAIRMADLPDLHVQFFLNIPRPDADQSPSEVLVTRFKQRFKDTQWPVGCRLPEVYCDPRSLADNAPVRSSLHAKCVVVDLKHVFVSSANFTEAGQERNIEVGLKIEDEWLAKRITAHFRHLHDHGLAVRAF